MKKHAKQIFWNTLLLTVAGLFIRTVGVGFQVYLSNRVGAEAMGLFSLMSGVYGFALTFATSGIYLGVTHLVVDALGKKQPERIAPAMRRAILYALSFGTAAFLLLYGFARPIGILWLKDERTVTSLRLFGISLPLISLSSVFSGYFSAVRRSFKNAAVQVFEQAVKIGFTVYLLAFLFPHDIEKTCCAMVLGGVLAEVVSFFCNFLLYLADRKRYTKSGRSRLESHEGKRLIKIALPVAITAYIRSALVTVEHVLIPEGLRNSGSSHQTALIAYGSIQSMALPIIFYPAALISSFAGLIVPEIAECHVEKSTRRIAYMLSRVWWIASLFSIGVAGILICFSFEIGDALYPGTEAGKYIRMLAPLIPIMYVDTATDAVMKGLGEQIFSMNINIADALISVVMVWLLIPRFGIAGYLVTIYFSEIFNTVLSIWHLLSITSPHLRLFKWVAAPLLSILGATYAVRLLLLKSSCLFANRGLSIFIHIAAVFALYFLLLRMLGGIDREDMKWIGSLFTKESRQRSVDGEPATTGRLKNHRNSLRNWRP